MSEENMLIIKQINKFGRVLGTQELFKMTEDLEQERDKYKEVIDKAIEMIKDYIPEEYVRSCDTSDGIGRYELDTESWQYKVYEMLKEVK